MDKVERGQEYIIRWTLDGVNSIKKCGGSSIFEELLDPASRDYEEGQEVLRILGQKEATENWHNWRNQK